MEQTNRLNARDLIILVYVFAGLAVVALVAMLEAASGRNLQGILIGEFFAEIFMVGAFITISKFIRIVPPQE